MPHIVVGFKGLGGVFFFVLRAKGKRFFYSRFSFENNSAIAPKRFGRD